MKHVFSNVIFFCLCVSLLLAAPPLNAASGENVLSLERMGAGAPAGWKVTLENSTWNPEPAAGPLGIGAARIHFDGNGSLTLVGPAKALPAGAFYAAALWIRSEPAGMTVTFDLRDNETEKPIALHADATASGEWRLIRVMEPLPASVTGHYYLDLTARGQNSDLFLDGLWMGPVDGPLTPSWRPNTREAGVTLDPIAPWGVIAGDASQSVRARVCGITTPGASLAITATNTLGQSATIPAVPMDTSGFWQRDILLQDPIANAFGMLRVEAHVEDAAGNLCSNPCETLLARAPEPLPGPMPQSYFGVHVLLRDPDLEAVSRLGYKWCRIHDASNITKWGYIEPEPGRWLWHDDDVALARSHGLSILGMLDTAPAWETGATDTGYFQPCHAPKDLAKWRNYVHMVTGHYAGVIDEWEVWNEPWDMKRFFQDGTPMLYVRLLQAAYEEAKAANPNATIVGIDTYPPLWENAILAMGAYPYYDKLSWHRYDPEMPGRPNDGIVRATQRIEAAQRKKGEPKPMLCSEGGPDVARYHGSFFSFAEPGLFGPWDEGADRYSRFILSTIAAGNERYIAYSMHAAPRHGWLTHNMIEPQFLVKPMHLAAAALAHFVDGAPYGERLRPAPGISAHCFTHAGPRPFASGPCTVAALVSDGSETLPLPKPIPEDVRCFDRWANPLDAAPTEATRAIVYLVAEGDAQNALRDALTGTLPPLLSPTTDDLLNNTLAALTTGAPPLWTLFSIQGSAAFLADATGLATATRAQLQTRQDIAQRFTLPGGARILSKKVSNAGAFQTAIASLECGGTVWSIAISAVQDAPDTGWQLVSLTLLHAPAETAIPLESAPFEPLRVWDACLREGKTDPLYATLYDGQSCMAASTRNGEYMLFTCPDYLVTMLKTVLMWGAAGNTPLTLDACASTPDLAVVSGQWDIASLAFGKGRYTLAATVANTPGGWKLATLCVGPTEE